MSSSTEQFTGATPPQQPQPAKKGLAVASMVLGILAILGCLIPVLNIGSIILAIISIILGALALRGLKRGGGGKGMAVTGLVLSILAILGAILANVLFGAAVNAVDDSIQEQQAAEAPTADQPVEAQFPGQTEDDVTVQAGSAVSVNGIDVTATPLAPQSDALGSYLCSTVTYLNNSDSPASFNSFDWALQDPAGASRTVATFGDNSLQSGDLAPGGTVTGDVCFDGSTTNPGQYVVLYDASIFGNARGAWINTL